MVQVSVSHPSVKPVSFQTAERCFDRLGPNKVNSESASNRANAIIPDAVSIDELKDIALKRCLKLKLVRFGWDMLRAGLSADPILLILRNGNVVLAVRSDPNSTSQIVVFDPLYPRGKDFLLPRKVLETVWDGDAIVVNRLSSYPRWLRSLVPSTAVCMGLIGIGLVVAYPGGMAEEDYTFTAMQDSEPLPSDASSIAGPGLAIGAKTAVPESGGPLVNARPAVGAAPFISAARVSASEMAPLADPVVPERAPAGQNEVRAAPNPEPVVPDREPVAPDQEPLPPKPEPVVPAREPLSEEAAKPEITAGPGDMSQMGARVVSVGDHPEQPRGGSTPTILAPTGAPVLGALTQPTAADPEPITERLKPENHAGRGNVPEAEARSAPTAPSAGQLAAVAPDPQNSGKVSEIAALVAHGDRLFGKGDLASARLFYERAAEAGHGSAALRLGESYDPSFLGVNGIPVRGDPILAVHWYHRARQLGVPSAEVLLNALAR